MQLAPQRSGPRATLAAALALATSALAAAQGGSFVITATAEPEISAGVSYDGANFLVGLQGDASDHSTIRARFVTPGGTLGANVTTGRTGGVPFVAFGGTRHLLVWEDDATSPDDHVYGMLIAPDGTHGAPFVVSQQVGNEEPCGVAFAGTRFLVTYLRGDGLYARVVTPTGGVGAELWVAAGVYSDFLINDVAAVGSGFLVAWVDDANRSVVRGRTVQASGVMGLPFVVDASANASDDILCVGSNGTSYLVVYSEEQFGPAGGERDLYARKVSAAGVPIGVPIAVSTAPGRQFGPFIASDGTDYLVAWTDMRHDLNGSWACDAGEATCWDIYGRYLASDGTPLADEWAIIERADDQYASPLAFGSGQYLMAWTDGTWANEGGDVYGLFLPPAPQVTSYCTGKLNTAGCVPSVQAAGLCSVTSPEPFVVRAIEVLNEKAGLFFYGLGGRHSAPFKGGTLCVKSPLRRTPIQFSGGNVPPPDDCSGVLSIDLNLWIQSGVDPRLGSGQTLDGQFWYRDPTSSFTIGLSDAIEVVVGP